MHVKENLSIFFNGYVTYQDWRGCHYIAIVFNWHVYIFYQILHGVSVLQKLPELASDITNPEAQSLYSQMTQKHYKRWAELLSTDDVLVLHLIIQPLVWLNKKVMRNYILTIWLDC